MGFSFYNSVEFRAAPCSRGHSCSMQQWSSTASPLLTALSSHQAERIHRRASPHWDSMLLTVTCPFYENKGFPCSGSKLFSCNPIKKPHPYGIVKIVHFPLVTLTSYMSTLATSSRTRLEGRIWGAKRNGCNTYQLMVMYMLFPILFFLHHIGLVEDLSYFS